MKGQSFADGGMAKGGKPKVIHTQFEEEEFEYAEGGMMADGGMMAKGGEVTFDDKVKAISKKLEGKPVPVPYRKEYGSRYDKEDAQEAARRIVGNMRKLYGE